jgi:hypothetical protein
VRYPTKVELVEPSGQSTDAPESMENGRKVPGAPPSKFESNSVETPDPFRLPVIVQSIPPMGAVIVSLSPEGMESVVSPVPGAMDCAHAFSAVYTADDSPFPDVPVGVRYPTRSTPVVPLEQTMDPESIENDIHLSAPSLFASKAYEWADPFRLPVTVQEGLPSAAVMVSRSPDGMESVVLGAPRGMV